MEPGELLKKHFNWDEFKPGQAEVIQRLFDGHSTLAVFPTGGGKSLCYQLPSLTFEGLTIIVSPLIALMKDQIDQLLSRGILAVRLDSSLTGDEYRQAMNQIRNGEAKMLFVAPERFFNERFRFSLQGVRISLFAIDEAHCISQWGHNFRPDYLKLARLARNLKVERVLALTATATPDVQQDICSEFGIASENVVCTEFFRPNLHIRSQVVTDSERLNLLLDKLKSEPPGATIVYVTLQKTAVEVAEACAEAGLYARPYHAGMETDERDEVQEWFMNGESNIVVATIAFGMGIDKSDIRYVYHYNAPKSIESYAQEIGRAGRDGKVSRCEMLLVPRDRITLENFVYGDTPSLPSIHALLDEIAKKDREFYISHITISNQCDIKTLVTQTLLTYLELDGYIGSTAPRYDEYLFKPVVSSAMILEQLNGEPQTFARNLLGFTKKRKIWFSIDIPDVVKTLNCDRSRVVKALDYFAEKGWIELNVSGLVHGYRRLKTIPSTELMAKELSDRLVRREQAEVERTRQVFELGTAKVCQADALSRHFGQPLESPCGQCSYCRSEGPFEIEPPPSPDLDHSILKLLKPLVAQHPEALNTTRAQARFLCGLTSPALIRSKLSRNPAFGICQDIPFDHVMRQLDETSNL